jgi:hypothetical protein
MAGEIFVGSVAVGVVPDARGIDEKMRKQVVPAAEKVGDEAGTAMGKALTTRLGWAGEDAGDEFGKRFREHLEAALAKLPKVKLDGDTEELDLKLEEIRRKIEEIHNQPVLDSSKATEEIAVVTAELEALKSKAHGIDLTFNTHKATAELAKAVETAVGAGTEKGVKSGVGKAATDVEAIVQTGSGVAAAGSSILGNILSLFGGGGSGGKGGGGIAGAASGSSGGALSKIGGAVSGAVGGIPLIGGLISGPQAAITIPAIATLVTLVVQQVGGAIVGGLGTVLAGMGIAGALMSGKLATPLKDLSTAFHNFMISIGGPLVPVLASVLDVISRTITTLTPVFKGAEQIISGPLQKFLTAIVQSFGLPSVATSIDAVARAFGSILDAITPTIAPNMDKLATAITNIANQISNNPQAIADFFTLITNFVVFLLNAIGSLTNLATKLEQQWPWVAKALGIKSVPGPAAQGTPGQATQFGQSVPATVSIPAIAPVKGRAAVPAHAAVYDPKTHKLIHPATAAIPGVAAVPGVAGTAAWAGYQPITHLGLQGGVPNALVGPPASQYQISYAQRINPNSPYSAVHTEANFNKLPGWQQAIVGAENIVTNMFATQVQKTWGSIWNSTVDFFTGGNNPPSGVMTGRAAAAGLTAKGEKAASSPDFTDAIAAKMGDFIKAGADIIKGVTQGAAVQSAASGPEVNAKITTPYVKHINDGFQTHSPSKETIPTGKDLIGGIMQGMQIAVGGLPPWIATWVVAPILTALVGDTYGFGMSNAGTTAGMQPAQQTVKIGWGIVDGMKEGITEEMIGMDIWLNTAVVQPIITYLTSPNGFNIKSPSKKMKPIGSQIVEGIIHGMMDTGGHIGQFVAKVFGDWPKAILSFVSKGLDPTKLNPAAQKFLQGIIGQVGGAPVKGGKYIPQNITRAWRNIISSGTGVARWAGDVSKALTMLGLPQALSGQVLYQMQTESGGDPNAINLTDSNARKGDPSRGLLQTIGATFAQYHVKGTSENIYDPLANIAAAINYAMHKYGPTLMNVKGQGMGSGHGYDTGGWLPPGVTLAYNNTGKSERILSPDELTSLQAGGTQYHAHFDGLTGAAIESHVQTAFSTMSLTQGYLQRQGRRS